MGAWPFAQTAQERTSALPHMEALSAGEASLFAVRTNPTLSVAAFGVFRFITKSYVTTFRTGLQAAEPFLLPDACILPCDMI